MILPALFTAALAHTPGLSYAAFSEDAVLLTFARPELGALMGLEPDQLAGHAPEVAGKVLAGVQVSSGGAPCATTQPKVSLVENDGVQIFATLECAPPDGPGGDRMYEAKILEILEPGHRHYVEVNGEPAAVLDASAPRVQLGGGGPPAPVFSRFLGLGLEHIITGFDHLAFLAGLLLGAKNLRSMLLIVTSFTLAHSITLSAAALQLVEIPAAIVEPAIAATIVWVGVENLFRPSERRYLLTFGLGLIHGFGFAGLLRELGLPQEGLVLALVSFNLGIELGQAALALLALPLLLALRRFAWFERRALPALSALVALAGLGWLAERLLG